jgi:hypothetical protein
VEVGGRHGPSSRFDEATVVGTVKAWRSTS